MNGAERNARKKIRISIIDVLIILAVAACIVGTFVHYRIFENNNKVVADDESMISVLYSGVTPQIADGAVSGDKIYFADGRLFGTVVEVSADAAAVYYKDTEGKWVLGSDESTKDLKLTVQTEGDFTDNGFLVNGTDYVAAGMEIETFTAKFSGKGLIFDVEKQSE